MASACVLGLAALFTAVRRGLDAKDGKAMRQTPAWKIPTHLPNILLASHVAQGPVSSVKSMATCQKEGRRRVSLANYCANAVYQKMFSYLLALDIA